MKTIYETEDGQQFDSQSAARDHEEELDVVGLVGAGASAKMSTRRV